MSSENLGRRDTVTVEQFELMRKVYVDIARETWFDDTQTNPEALAALVLHNFRAGRTSEFDLPETCHDMSRDQFRR